MRRKREPPIHSTSFEDQCYISSTLFSIYYFSASETIKRTSPNKDQCTLLSFAPAEYTLRPKVPHQASQRCPTPEANIFLVLETYLNLGPLRSRSL
ncbi:unnamed protein product [Sphacelaria rigidula]